jgi:hypothetical protein
VITLKLFPEILPRYFPSDPLQVLSRNIAQIFHRYISKYFPPEKYLQNHFSSPYKCFLHNFPHALKRPNPLGLNVIQLLVLGG